MTLAVLAAAALPGAAGAATSAPSDSTPVTLSASPLGVDIAPWDPVYSTTANFNAVQPLLKAAGFNEIHYSGGVTADQYDWQTDTDLSNCPAGQTFADFSAACVTSDALDFSLLSQHARDLGAQTFATVNYGTGTPDLAAAWVAQAAATPGQQVSDWEIGNESYGCWMEDEWLADPPANIADYVPNGPCPTTAVMANSYAVHAGDYMTAMKAADPNAQIGVPWAFDNGVGGAAVANNTTWNDTILQADGADISFVDAHWYPFSFGGNTDPAGKKNPSDQQVIQSVMQIPSEYAKIRGTLNTYDPGAQVIIGETGVSFLETGVPCLPAGALFAAGDVLSWLAAGAQSVNWWPLDTNTNLDYTGTSNCQQDEAMFTNPRNPATASPRPLTPYVGYLLASALAKPGAQLSELSQQGDVLRFQSVLPGGKVAVALINTNTGSAKTATAGSSLSPYLTVQTYSAGNQNSTNTKIATTATTAAAIASGITLPAESIVVLTQRTPKPSGMSLTATSATVKAGTKVTLTGNLTLNGAAAPAGVSVKVNRQVGGRTQATLTVKTAAGGGFTVTDIPPATGSYTYAASYVSNTYLPATANHAVTVTAAKPALKLAASAKSVKPGTKVTVTASLGAPHVNKTLVIYAQVKGGAKKVIKRATVNAKGQLSVVFTVKANTTFTVTFAGDTWYTAGSAAAAVKA
ncbi:hypothetical protein EAS64_39015 [Trebonia kvetii]|uniref:Alpha-L-arabinofuranosidase n=1 Tax=Trebonia kvetii TaxID=2480626 RepID=A0A6P2BN65_9ACTN|nr:hypothetical protein [Trebonia kvetii]TVZ00067.1 hypothetical protein EAS64_39015 [Trebonia kvetii]